MKRLLWISTLLTVAVSAAAGEYATYYRNLPDAVAGKMAEPQAPVIPDHAVTILAFGGIGDGITDNTDAFQKAISALAKQGGGHLVVPAGIFVTGPISLKDHIDLHLERNATILLTPDRSAHLKDGKAVPGITASKRTDVSITGEGIIDGNGNGGVVSSAPR